MARQPERITSAWVRPEHGLPPIGEVVLLGYHSPSTVDDRYFWIPAIGAYLGRHKWAVYGNRRPAQQPDYWAHLPEPPKLGGDDGPTT